MDAASSPFQPATIDLSAFGASVCGVTCLREAQAEYRTLIDYARKLDDEPRKIYFSMILDIFSLIFGIGFFVVTWAILAFQQISAVTAVIVLFIGVILLFFNNSFGVIAVIRTARLELRSLTGDRNLLIARKESLIHRVISIRRYEQSRITLLHEQNGVEVDSSVTAQEVIKSCEEIENSVQSF